MISSGYPYTIHLLFSTVLYVRFFYRFIDRFDTDFKFPRSERGFLLEGFFKNVVTVTTRRIILSSIDLFVLPFAISLILRAF